MVGVGFFLGLLQLNYYFLAEIFVSSASISFFVVLFFWLLGFYQGLGLKTCRARFRIWVLVSTAAYYLFYAAVCLWPFQNWIWGLAAVCVFVSGLLPGTFFGSIAYPRDQVHRLLIHENNGFLLGFMSGTLLALQAGQWLISYAVVVSALALWAHLFSNPKLHAPS